MGLWHDGNRCRDRAPLPLGQSFASATTATAAKRSKFTGASIMLLLLCLQIYILIGGLLALAAFFLFKKENEINKPQFKGRVQKAARISYRMMRLRAGNRLPESFEDLSLQEQSHLLELQTGIVWKALKFKLILNCLLFWPIMTLMGDLRVSITLNPIGFDMDFRI
jgi:CRISPR/Cas system CMR-associated protein Cmr5 small subunit